MFTKNKGAIDAMYARALRDNPALQGKVVIELTIAPSGDITAARIVSSELNDPEFETQTAGAHPPVQVRGQGRGDADRHQTHRFLPCRMNIQSEIEFFSDLGLVDKARFIIRLIGEVAEEAKVGAGDGQDFSRLRFSNEINQRLARFSYQLLSEDSARPADDVVIRMLLGNARRQERRAHHATRLSARADEFRELRHDGAAQLPRLGALGRIQHSGTFTARPPCEVSL